MRERPEQPVSRWRPRGWVVDAMLGAGVAVVTAAVITADYGGRQAPDAVAYLWAFGLGALLLARRPYPVLVLCISVLGLFAYYAAGYPAVGVAVPIAAALFSAAEFGRIPSAIAAGTMALAANVAFRLVEGQDAALVVGYELAGHALLVAAAIALGDGVRSRRRLIEGARRIVALERDRARAESERRMEAERVGVARDLHDSIGHAASVVSIYADVAREAIESSDERAARDALRQVKAGAADALDALRRTVAVLREGDNRGRQVARLRDAASALPLAAERGIEMRIDVPDTLPAAVDEAAFRVVQEALTNVVKHAPAAAARVTARVEGEKLVVTVADDGRGAAPSGPADPARGHGLAGMRERVAALGGELWAGPEESGGFVVRARVPLSTVRAPEEAS